ncbi:acid protease [Cylindrobasidium torrendii FP15055 ss-10]|uniref:Acid protease n=1 Tax=Cylindrobasidium torrendii FP15055 ss-10 TaxID=1314674 RepID=A0A0D7BME8_9AGAR|nr:acid protease [Cylindrobasidium torrendii FP15055 ss-10]
MSSWRWTALFGLASTVNVLGSPASKHRFSTDALSDGALHLPIFRSSGSNLQRRGSVGRMGLGDYYDVAYSVMVTVGDTQTPLLVDTGSADLWVTSTSCGTQECKEATVSLYDGKSFQSSDIPVEIDYGDSNTPTAANGTIGQDTVSIAGLKLEGQYLASMDSTNTSLVNLGDAGILGLGFPLNSLIWSQVFSATANRQSKRSPRLREPPALPFFESNLRRASFPSLNFDELDARQEETKKTSKYTSLITASYADIGPFLVRLVEQGQLNEPLFAVTLQRDTVDQGGNVGMLSIGDLPDGVNSDSLTWAPVRAYSVSDGGLSPPPDSPDEEYPISWEIFLDAIYFDGDVLPASELIDPSIKLSALLDTGNSLMRGPADLISYIYTKTGGTTFSCDTAHNFTVVVGGKSFPVDPRDFVYSNGQGECNANIAVTDVPTTGGGYLHTWSLGDPFLKSVLSAFHYGNLSHPSQDGARIGLLSTVPDDANEQYAEAVKVQPLFQTYEAAPTGLPSAASTNADGVAQAAETGSLESSHSDAGSALGIENGLVYGMGLLVLVCTTAFV